jgi:hypothetical protein
MLFGSSVIPNPIGYLVDALFLSSCASKKNIETKEKFEYRFQRISERFDSQKLEYIGLRKYCNGSLRIIESNDRDCDNCNSSYEMYFFWNENSKSYAQKFDDCSDFNIVEISDFKVSEFLNKNTSELQTEKVERYKVDKETYSTVSHSCFRNYILNDGNKKYEKDFDIYDLTGEKDNLHYELNNNLKIVQLDKKLQKIISELEKEDRFKRNKKTCYNTVYN